MGGNSAPGGFPEKTVAILGGGLAGLSVARCLLERGYRVTVVEKRPFLGGRAFSFHDPAVGCEVDNGQHIFMGCCTYYIDFLTAVDALDRTYLQRRLKTEIVLDGNHGTLASIPVLGALHLLPAFLGYRHLGFRDKLLVLYGLFRAKLTNRTRKARELDGQSFYDWLKRHHQTERAIGNLWNLIALPALNDDVRDVSAEMGLMLFQEGLLKRPRDAAIGFAKVGLTSLTGEPAGRFIEERGGEVVLGKGVRSVNVDDGRVTGVELSDGSTLRADAYVCALPFGAVAEVLPDEVAALPFFSRLGGLTSSPIVGIHIWYDRVVMEGDFIAFLDSPVQWVFNKSLIQGTEDQKGQYLTISVSAAWDFVDRPKEELRTLFGEEMRRLFPRARDAEIERYLVVKQRDATFRCTPGVAALRPSQVTPIANLFLAGEWTDTGWPSTMEGAVRSGVFAAEALDVRS